jgi:hypothetical protein
MVLIYFALSIVVGFVAAKLVETPFLALRDRLFPTRSQGARSTGDPAPAESLPLAPEESLAKAV